MLPAITIPLILALVIIITGVVVRSFIQNHPMFAIVDNKVAEFKKRTFASEEERVRAKEQFKTELTAWKSNIELKRQEILLRVKFMPIFGRIFLKKNMELIDNVEKKLQIEIDALK